MKPEDRGFSVVEVLVALGIFSAVGVMVFQVMLSTRSGSQTARDVVDVSEEGRLGLNRMVRDTREAREILGATATSFQIWTDFDSNGTPGPVPTDLTGSHEIVTYSWNAVDKTISITSGTSTEVQTTEVLVEGVDCIRNALNQCSVPVFTFSSSRLEFDSNGDGTTSVTELDQNLSTGDQDAKPYPEDGEEIFIDRVAFSLRITEGDSVTTVYSEAQLRNRR